MKAYSYLTMAARESSCPLVMLCGYYGEHNLGDDALLHVLVENLPDCCRIIITANDQGLIHRKYSSARVVNRRSLLDTIRALKYVDALVLGGGSLLQDSTSFKSLIYYLTLIMLARIQGVKVFLWGQGLGPLRRQFSRCLSAIILRSVQWISWRDPESMVLAKSMKINVPMFMAADPVWQIPQKNWIGGDGVVLCWRPTQMLDRDGWSVLIDALEILLSRFEGPVFWLAFHQDQDSQLLSTLDEKGCIGPSLKVRSKNITAYSIDEAMKYFSKAQLVLPMRLHALILSVLSGSPTAPLSYDPKVASASKMANLKCIDLQQLPNSNELSKRWADQLNKAPNPDLIKDIADDSMLHRALLKQTF